MSKYGSPSITERFPEGAVAEFRKALVRAGADEQVAHEAVKGICHAAHRYFRLRTANTASMAKVQRQLRAFADAADQLMRAMAQLNHAAMHELVATGDDDTPPDPAPGLSSLRVEIRRISGRYEKLFWDLRELGPRIELTLQRVKDQTRRGPRKNDGADALLSDVILTWRSTTGSWPSGARSEDGQARSPFPQLLRNLVSRIDWVDHKRRKKALSDDRFIAVLRDLKQHASTSGERPARRRRTKR